MSTASAPQGRAVPVPPAEYVKTIAQATMYGCLFFTDEQGHPVQLRSVYGSREWQFPGGNTDPGESPWQTAVRECEEETGIVFTGEPRLLVTHFMAPTATWPLCRVGFVFDGGVLTDETIRGIGLDPHEHDQVAVHSLERWKQIMSPIKSSRLEATAHARENGGGLYLPEPLDPAQPVPSSQTVRLLGQGGFGERES
ncbi:NUDIX domain-containing protein [Streptomyces sp. NPDC017260]|uniref:NUDIX domain-containing protein n=1 Tax=unclassified Streptomyces TaxID=2593676 RepID=UPI00378D0A48